jgi:hypothetical protein
MKTRILVTLFYIAIVITVLVGEIKCIYKAYSCNWDPIGKAEVFYTASALTGFGAIVGYLDINDN